MSGKCPGNSSRASLSLSPISANFLSTRPLRLVPSTGVYSTAIASSVSSFQNSSFMNSCPLSKRAMSKVHKSPPRGLLVLCRARKAWHKVEPLLSRRNSGHPTLVMSSTTSIQYRTPPADGGYGPVRSINTRRNGLPYLTFVSLGTARLIAFASPQPSQYLRVPITAALAAPSLPPLRDDQRHAPLK